MPPTANSDPALWPLALWLVAVAALIAVVISLSSLIGQRSRSRRRDLPYESGIAPTPQAPLRFPVHFYLIALAFLVFDIEAAILFGWAVAARDVGWAGYLEALVFAVILFAGLVYLWAKGAFLWGVERE
ncbi:MAG: NADH-quinone oxidoreductase subunit A [Acidobacteriota bacterium]|jgi:NADH-quinone oxidoreductase subunit A